MHVQASKITTRALTNEGAETEHARLASSPLDGLVPLPQGAQASF